MNYFGKETYGGFYGYYTPKTTLFILKLSNAEFKSEVKVN